jgi:hypothetical protein
MDVDHDGKVLSSVDTGSGVDDIDYAPATHLLYVGAARAGQLTIAKCDPDGKLSTVATVKTPVGARNPAATDAGAVYLAHSAFGGLSGIVVVEPAK